VTLRASNQACFRLDLAYDGTDFHGWQAQPGQRTVQGLLQDALLRLLRSEIAVEGAGRTDAGVHAIGQVASFHATTEREPEWLQHALRSVLPADLHVARASLASAEFSARRSAVARTYRYRMRRGPHVFWRRYCLQVSPDLQVDAMREAAAVFIGDHDFTAFAASAAGDRCQCLVERASVLERGPWVDFDVTANRFVHNMVRRVTGALLEVGMGRRTAADLEAILRSHDRTRGGPCLAPQGLFLVGVRYPGDPRVEPELYSGFGWND